MFVSSITLPQTRLLHSAQQSGGSSLHSIEWKPLIDSYLTQTQMKGPQTTISPSVYQCSMLNESTGLTGCCTYIRMHHQCKYLNNVVEAHCYSLQCRPIDCEQIHSRINQQLIAGRFGHKGLRQLHTTDSATYLLTINLPANT